MDQPKTHSTPGEAATSPESQAGDNSQAIENWRKAKRNREQTKCRRRELRMVAIAVVTGATVLLATRLTYSEPVSAATETRISPLSLAPDYPSTQAGALLSRHAEPVEARRTTTTLDATTYADKYVGRKTASGTVYTHESNIVASNIHELGSRISITYNGTTVKAVVADRLSERYSHRIDLSRSLWNRLTNNAAPGVAAGCSVEVTR